MCISVCASSEYRYHIGRRSRYGCYKLFVGEEAKDNLMKYALIARKAECDTPENHLLELNKYDDQ